MAVIDFKSVGERASSKKFESVANTVPIGIKTPLRLGTQSDGIFSMHYKVDDQIQDNFRNLLLTNKGERLGRYNYGADLRRLTFEHGHDSFDAEAVTNIKEAVERYMPFINPKTFESSMLPGADSMIQRVDIKIKYDVIKLGIFEKEIHVTLFVRG